VVIISPHYVRDLKGLVWLLTTTWYLDTDVKPNNVLISYTSRSDSVREIDRVSLSDTEDAARVKSGEGIFVQVGNVLWRSPEAQSGTRVGKASDVWSFGVTVSAPILMRRLEFSIHVPV